MRTRNVVLVGVVIVLVLTFIYFGFFYGAATGEVVALEVNESNGHYTTAVCDDANYCQDYLVVCDNGTMVEMQLLEGADYQHDEDWVDLRSEEEKEICYGQG